MCGTCKDKRRPCDICGCRLLPVNYVIICPVDGKACNQIGAAAAADDEGQEERVSYPWDGSGD